MEDFVPYELAFKLKEKGFREKTLGFYMLPIKRPLFPLTYSLKDWNKANDCYSAPTISQVLTWLREEKKIFIAINIGYCYEPFLTNPNMEPILKGYYYGIWELDNLNNKNALSEYFETPELAAIAGIKYVIDNGLI